MKRFIHYIFWFLIFNQGLFNLLGIPTSIYKIGIPVVGFFLFGLTAVGNEKKLKKPLLAEAIFFICVSLLSMLLNKVGLISLVQFLFITILPYFYFLVIVNEDDTKLVNSVTKWVLILVLVQIPAIIIKFFILGQSEKGAIGTMSVGDGSLSTVFPILTIGILVSLYLYFGKKRYVILIICYILFGIIGKKRAIVFLIPLEFITGYFLFLVFFVEKIDFEKIRKLVLIVIVGFFAFYMMVRTNPTLNKEQSNWGTFDITYLMSYSNEYTSARESKMEMRRKDGFIYFFKYNFNSKFSSFLLGDGAGVLVQSSLNPNSGTMAKIYGVRYGGRMGSIWILLQIGFLGLISYMVLIGNLIRLLITRSKIIGNYLLLGFLISSIYLFLDFMFYSPVFVSLNIISCLYFYIAAIVYIGGELENKEPEKKLLMYNRLKF